MTFKAIFMQKNTKNDKNVSTLWRHYDDVKTTADKILNTIFGILVQLAFRMVIMFFFHWVGDRAKIWRDKKKWRFCLFLPYFPLYCKMYPRAEFHKIRYLSPVRSTNSLNIWFLWLPMTPCSFLWGSLDGPSQNVAPNKFLC